MSKYFENMKKIRCVIVDDDPSSQFYMEHVLEKYEKIEISGTMNNAGDALEFLSKGPADVLILSVQLPDISGFDMLKRLKRQPMVVFTSNHHEHAASCFRFNVVDFMVKPVTKSILQRALCRVIERAELYGITQDGEQQKKHYEIELSTGKNPKKIIDTSTIVYVKSYGNYVKLNVSGNTVIANIRTKDILEMLPSSKFLRVHKSYIVNVDHVRNYNGDIITIATETLPIGISFRYYVEAFFERNSNGINN